MTTYRSSETSISDRATIDAKFFQGLADPTRMAILELLLTGERNVTEIVDALGGSQSRISNHLACLRTCGFVTTHRKGLFIYYQVSDPRVPALVRLGQTLARDNEEGLRTCLRLQSAPEDPTAHVAVVSVQPSVNVTLADANK